MHLLANLVLE